MDLLNIYCFEWHILFCILGTFIVAIMRKTESEDAYDLLGYCFWIHCFTIVSHPVLPGRTRLG